MQENKNKQEEAFTVKAGLQLRCLSFFSAGVGRVGIRNNCAHCMTAVVYWTPTVGTRRYNIQGNSHIVIESESQTGQLIGEEEC